nr:MAG TPA_asm: hypothetical protein [Caudoviricetes sp.]DAM05087.1 MAG TPA: hypothetical protein [Caudoviricetes sp.]
MSLSYSLSTVVVSDVLLFKILSGIYVSSS